MPNKRLTNHNGRKAKDGAYSAKHNDRNYDVAHSKQVDPDRTPLNRNWHIYPKLNLTFEEAEKKFYEENFRYYLDAKNQRYINGHHRERVQTMDEYRRNERSCPEETIMQIGSVEDGTIDTEEFWKICLEQINWENKTFPNVEILDIALHMDETTPHLHERKVWTISDDNGNKQVNQTKALEAMGIERPDMSKPKDRYNNPKVTYSKIVRDHFVEVCKAHGIEIEEEPKEASESGLSLTEFKLKKDKEKLEKTEAELADATERLESAEEKLNEAKTKISDYEEKVRMLSDSVERYLAPKEKKKLLKEDTYEMSKSEYEQFEKDKMHMAESARIILEAENIKDKEKKLKEYKKAKEDLEDAKFKLSQTQRQLSVYREQLKDAETEFRLTVKNAELEKERDNYKRKYEDLNVILKAIVNAINKLDEVINRNPDIIPEFIKSAIKELKEIVDEKVEPEHEKQYWDR